MSIFLLAALLGAQSGVTMTPGTTGSHASHAGFVHMECAAFRSNANGSWTSVRTTKVGSVSISDGGTFFPGVRLGGTDVAAQLTAQCRKPRSAR